MKKLGKKLQQVERSVEAYNSNCGCGNCYCYDPQSGGSAGNYVLFSAYGSNSY